MKISTQGTSRFLSLADLDTPLLLTMDHFTEDNTLRNPLILHFREQVKPLPLNVTNRRILVAAFGDDPAALRGRQIEVYFDPTVPNPRDPSRPGGVKVRVPTVSGTAPAPLGGNGAQPVTGTAPKTAPPPVPRPTPAQDPHARALAGMDHAQDRANLDAWAQWRKKFPTTSEQQKENEEHYRAALERVGAATPLSPVKRPARA